MTYDEMIDRFLEDFETYQNLGEERGVSRQRIHQIIVRELDKSVGAAYRKKLLDVRSRLKSLNVVTCYCGKVVHLPPSRSFCTKGCVVAANKMYTREEGLVLLRSLANKLERTPTVQELVEDSETPSLTWYQNMFGAWRNAVVAAGLTPRSSGDRV
jgi:hypothetical protein